MKSLYFAGCRSAQLLFILAFFATIQLHAQQATLSIQGVLTKADGTAVDDDTYDIEFSLWRSPSGTLPGDKVYTELIATQTTGGVYSVILGLAQPLNAPFNEPYWLGVKYGATELLPRPRLTSAPFALSLLGQSNTFPSTGTVIADNIQTNSYNFKGTPGTTSGLFWNGETDIRHNGGSRILIGANGTNYVSGGTVFNNETSTTGRVNSSVGFGYNATGTGLFFDGTENKASIYTTGSPRFHAWDDGRNYYRAPNGHVFDVGNVQLSNNLQVNGFINCNSYVRATGTYAFTGDDDSGMFSPQDGRLQFRVNGQLVAQFDQPTPYTNNETVGSSIRFFGIQKGPNNPEVEWDEVTGQLQVDNSSRKYKRNIEPLRDDFTLILKAEPKLYNRIGYPDDLLEAGYIAEEFDSLGLTRLVHYNRLGEIIGVNYKKISIYLTEIVKKHHSEIDNMKAEIAALKAEKAALQKENQTLRAESSAMQSKQAEFGAQLEALAKRVNSLEGTTTASKR